MTHVLGVDGGNTKTVALVAEPSGRIVGYGRGGCGDISVGASEAPALGEIAAAVEAALAMAGVRVSDLAVSQYCLAGADWPEDHAFLRDALGASSGPGRLLIDNDSLAALRAGSPDGTGVVVSCGTGIATAARNAAGAFWYTGYWAEPLCGVELGRQALKAVYRAELGIDQPTGLRRPVLAAFGEADVETLLHRFEGRHTTKPTSRQLSRLAPLVLDAAALGDGAAARIVAGHAAALADYARVAANRVGLDIGDCPMVLNGGVFRHRSGVLRAAVMRELGREGGLREGGREAVLRQVGPEGGREPAAEAPPVPTHEPAVGALLLALEAHGVRVDDRVMHAVETSLPPADLYAS